MSKPTWVAALLLVMVTLLTVWWLSATTKQADAYTTLWIQQFGTNKGDSSQSVAVDDSGIYIAGFTGGALRGQSSSGDDDAFLRKYDQGGNEIWTRQFGSSEEDYASAIALDASGVYLAGWTSGTLPGQSSSGGPDAYVRKYDHEGNQIWTRQFGPPTRLTDKIP